MVLSRQGHLDAISSTSMKTDAEISVLIPDDHLIHEDHIMIYRYDAMSGELIRDEERRQTLIEERRSKTKQTIRRRIKRHSTNGVI